MRTMYDGINSDAGVIHSIYKPGDLVAGYSSGTYTWSNAEWGMFPVAARVRITPLMNDTSADVIDCEAGDATPEQAAMWMHARRAMGYSRPSTYASLSIVPQVVSAASAMGLVLARDWDLWVADWDGTTVIPYPHAAAKQERNAGSYDVSVVYDGGWPHRTSVRPPPDYNFTASGETTLTLSWNSVPGTDHYVGLSDRGVASRWVPKTGMMRVTVTVPASCESYSMYAILNNGPFHIGTWNF